MKGFRSLLLRTPLTLKMIILTFVVGIIVWVIADFFVSGAVKTIFEAYLSDILSQQSQEDRLRFDNYMKNFHQVVKLAVSQKRFTDYLDKKKWFSERGDEITSHTRLPQWFLNRSALRALASPRYAILFDANVRAREVFHKPQERLPRAFLKPDEILFEKSHGQTYIAIVEGLPYMITSEFVTGPGDNRVTLMLISPIDDQLLLVSQGDYPKHLVGLVSGDNQTIITSNKPDLLPPGAKLDSLKGRYVITGREFHDYGSAEMVVNVSSFVPTARIEEMSKSFVQRDRQLRVATALVLIIAFTMLMFWITIRIRNLTLRVEDFSQRALGGTSPMIQPGDKLNILEERFQLLTEEVISSQETIRKDAEEKAKRKSELERKDRQLNLLQTVTKAMGVGVMIENEKGLRPANDLMNHFYIIFGELSLFNINKGSAEERTIEDHEGNEYIFHLSSPDFFPDEKVVLANDITRQKLAETEKQQLQRELTQAQRLESIGRLAGGIAHDFNNLLTAMIGHAELISDRMVEDSESRSNVDIIINAGEKAADLVKQLLAFSRKQMINPEILDLNNVIDSMIKMLCRLIEENIELDIRKGKDLWNIFMDKAQIEQVIMNLIVNARDAMSYGGKLTIRTNNITVKAPTPQSLKGIKPGDYVRLSVSDTGYGIPEDNMAYIFEPFFTTKEMGKGTGLGLATVYGIVKQNYGNIFVDSEVGKGTTFRIYLKRESEEPEYPITEEHLKGLPRGSESILLVEDEEGVRNFISTVLSELGYLVAEANDGKEAIDFLEKNKGRFHLLLTDVVMPGISGSELSKRIKKEYLDMKVIFMSGYAEETVIGQDVLKGKDIFLQKPVTSRTLALAVRRTLDGKQKN